MENLFKILNLRAVVLYKLLVWDRPKDPLEGPISKKLSY
jgi:hypothetical protein